MTSVPPNVKAVYVRREVFLDMENMLYLLYLEPS
jgi:hypothetical protein